MASTPINESQAQLDLLAALPILDEATTSRVVVNNPLLRHVLFSMDKGQVLTEHSSPRAVVVTLLSGDMEFTVAGTAHNMVAGDVIYLAPGERHAVVATSPCHMALTLVDTDFRQEG